MECRLQQASLWSCKIKLRFQYSALGQPLNDMREVDFGDILYDKRQVGQMLRRAQRAILRPTLNPADFLDDTDLEKDGHPPLTFSKNCVCINVSGPNVPDLYFYDLPGKLDMHGSAMSLADAKVYFQVLSPTLPKVETWETSLWLKDSRKTTSRDPTVSFFWSYPARVSMLCT